MYYKKYAQKYYREHREERKEYNREYRESHKVEAKKYNRKKYLKIKVWLNNNIEALRCLDCNLSFKGRPWLADFHHISKRRCKGSIITLVKNSSYNQAVRELNKGVFLCPTCHRIRDN